MSRGLHRIAGLVLLGVLSGAPAVAVICAELCAPAAHQQPTEHDGSSCHGRTGRGPAMTGQPPPDCGDHGAATVGTRASLVASRGSSLAVLHVVDSTAAAVLDPAASSGRAVTLPAGQASPPRPTRSSLVLRI